MEAICHISKPTLQQRAQELTVQKSRFLEPAFWGLTLMAGLLFFGQMDAPLQEPEEPRYAEIPRQMLEAGQWLVPTLHGQPYLDKPPLLYWLVMSSYQIFGVHDWSARLPACLAAFFTVIVTYFWTRQALGSRPALMAAGILALSGRFVYLGRLLTMNSSLALCVTASLAAAHMALSGPRFRLPWWLLSALACGLGILTKGAVALVLVLVPVVFFVLLDSRGIRLTLGKLALFLLASLGVAAPWLIWMTIQDPGFLAYFFWKHHLVRYLAPFDHAKPAWYFLGEVLLGMFPWTLLLWPLGATLLREDQVAASQRPAVVKFALFASLWSLLFFSLSGSKRAGYVLPALPPLALVLGWYLDFSLRFVSVREAYLRWSSKGSLLGWRIAGLVLVLGMGGTLAAFHSALLSLLLAVVSAGFLAIGLAAVIWHPTRTAPRGWLASATATFIVLFGAVYLVYPAYARRFSMRDKLQPFIALANDTKIAIVSYPRCWDSVTFYLRRGGVQIYAREEQVGLLAYLKQRTQTLAIYKADEALDKSLDDLPMSLRFILRDQPGSVAVGWFRPIRLQKEPASLVNQAD